MVPRRTLTAFLLALCLLPSAWAGGLSLRAEASLSGLALRGYLEEDALRLGPLSVQTGIHFEFSQSLYTVTPYTSVRYLSSDWSLTLGLMPVRGAVFLAWVYRW